MNKRLKDGHYVATKQYDYGAIYSSIHEAMEERYVQTVIDNSKIDKVCKSCPYMKVGIQKVPNPTNRYIRTTVSITCSLKEKSYHPICPDEHGPIPTYVPYNYKARQTPPVVYIDEDLKDKLEIQEMLKSEGLDDDSIEKIKSFPLSNW